MLRERAIKETWFMRITQNKWTVRLSLAGLGLFALLSSSRVVLTAQTPVVYVAPIEGIDRKSVV